MGCNFESFEDKFTDGSLVSLVSLNSCFHDRTLFTIGAFPRHMSSGRSHHVKT